MQLFPDCKYKLTESEFSIGEERFTWSGLTPVTPGYTEVYSWHAIQGSESFVQFTKGQIWEVKKVLLFNPL